MVRALKAPGKEYGVNPQDSITFLSKWGTLILLWLPFMAQNMRDNIFSWHLWD